ncbi:hypothetical protein VVR26_06385 [Corynebacterium camporealensis]|uniref:hypothetical protein n=1 Tax=Corynebacterium camporealensis TaxID=161896 RepID=UPI0034CF0F04
MSEELTLATFSGTPSFPLRGKRFTRAYAPRTDYPSNRKATLTGQYPQREALTTISAIFSNAGWHTTEGLDTEGPTFRLLEEPDSLPDSGVIAVATGLATGDCELYIYWPGVAEDGESAELVSPLDLAPTLAAIAGLDVRPNAALSFDGLNLVPVLRYGADGHAALFFDNGIRTQDAWLINGHCSHPDKHTALEDEWQLWKQFMDYGPLQ